MGVLIVAASPLARAGLKNLLKGRGVEVVGTAASLDALRDQPSDAAPDVALLDATGEALEPILESLAESAVAEDCCVLLVTDSLSPVASTLAFRAGIRAILPSDVSAEQLDAALQAAASGLLVLHPANAPTNFGAARAHARSTATIPSPSVEGFVEALTPRESEVLQMLAAGLGNKEIAGKLGISDHTVKFHVASILGKLGVSSRTEAVSFAIRRGLVLL